MEFTKENIRKSFKYVVVAFILFLIFIPKKCTCDNDVEEPTIEVKTDTIWKTVHDTITKEVKVLSYKYVIPKGEEYKSSENIDSCNRRLATLVKKHTKLSIYQDTITFKEQGVKGNLIIRDTVWLNKFKGKRQYINNLEFPTITNTVTITKPADPVRQLYMGGNIFGNSESLSGLTPGILYKDRKDRIYMLNLFIGRDGALVGGVGYYHKINLRKKK
tara:strand:- start:5062 stop:5712 length:651 start_codon:yes stop_codon:yes gene_type:complete